MGPMTAEMGHGCHDGRCSLEEVDVSIDSDRR